MYKRQEEVSRFPSGCQGSRAICGTLKEEDLEELSRDGVTLREALVSAGYRTEVLKNVKRDDIRAIVELHIEQGPVLESEQKQIGIVAVSYTHLDVYKRQELRELQFLIMAET